MASGVRVNDECCRKFDEVKMKKKDCKKRKFTVLKISGDDKEIVPDEDYEFSEICDFQELLKVLPPKDGRYIIYDYAFEGTSGQGTSKLILLMWVPEEVPTKKKMMYASSKGYVKKMINEEVPEFQCDCCDDLPDKDVLAKLRK